MSKYDLSKQDSEEVLQLENQLNDYENFLITSMSELFSDNPLLINPSSIQSRPQMNQNSEATMLDFNKLKKTVMSVNDTNYICAVLNALRWRITKADSLLQRRETIIQYSNFDLVDYEFFNTLIEKKSKMINEHLIALLNALSSDYLGRSYLTQNEQVVSHLVHILKAQIENNFTRKICLAILQKLSLRKKCQDILIKNGIIKWVLDVLNKERTTACEYTLEYLSALLMNLSLRTIGKEKFDENKFLALNTISDYLEIEDEGGLKQHMLGTLYSILNCKTIKSMAVSIGYIDKLENMVEGADEFSKSRYQIILKKLTTDEVSDDLSTIDEDDAQADVQYDEDLWEEDEMEIPPEIVYKTNGEELLDDFRLQGDQAKQQFQLVSALLDETFTQSKLELTKGGIKSNVKDEFVLRPSTPFKQQIVS